MNGLNLNTVEEGTIFIGDDKPTHLKRRVNGRFGVVTSFEFKWVPDLELKE